MTPCDVRPRNRRHHPAPTTGMMAVQTPRPPSRCRRVDARHPLVAGIVAGLALLAAGGCSAPAHLAVAHRHSPGSEARIVVLPVSVPADVPDADEEGRTLANLYATELLRSYEVLDYDRFRVQLQAQNLSLDSLMAGDTQAAADKLQIDGILQSEVYRWSPGKPGFWFLAKEGQVGFQAHLVDVRTGSVIWSVNRVRATRPRDTLSVGMAAVFQDLAAKMPRSLTPF